MKSKMKKIILLLFLLISVSITSQNQYYYYEGQKQILETVNDYVFVAIKNSLSYEETVEQQIVAEEFLILDEFKYLLNIEFEN